MALTPFGRPGSMFDTYSLMNSFDPFEMWDPTTPERKFARHAHAVAATRVDWVENDKEHVFKVEVPGLTKEDIKVHVVDVRTLEISGERSKEEEQTGDTFHRVERSYGQFMRRFVLPDNANVDEVSAKAEHGILTVTVPKIPEHQPQRRTITVS